MDDEFRGRAGRRRGRRWVTGRRSRMDTPSRPRWLWLELAPRRPPAWPRPPPFRQRRSRGSLLEAGGERGKGGTVPPTMIICVIYMAITVLFMLKNIYSYYALNSL